MDPVEKRAHEVFLALLDKDKQDRVAAMLSLCGDDEALKQEVQKLLDAQESLGSFDEREGAIEPTIIQEVPPGPATDAGQSLGGEAARFRILRPHARGGLGEVSVAKDTELNRDVALKEIQERYADDEASRSRFLLEAEVTGGLEHPGIVPVYGLGRYDDGRPYYAMRFIRGDSLKEAADRFHGRAPSADPEGQGGAEATTADFQGVEFRKLLGRFIDVCQAIEYAHSRGVLHRDLKPGNIMLGKYGETLVVDWGLAKTKDSDDDFDGPAGEAPLRPASASSAAPTMMGSAIGTPSFMPPEQAAGRLDQLGPASDVYSLGATLYYMLAGRAPFKGQAIDELLDNVKSGTFPAPRTLQPAAPKALEAVCLKAMALQPDQRYASPEALADDIERFLADESVRAFAEPVTVRARRWIRKNQTLAASTAAVVLVSTVGLGVFSAVVSGKNTELNAANRMLDGKNFELDNKNNELTAANKRELDARKLAESNEKAARGQSQLALSTLASVIDDIDSGLRNMAGSAAVRRRLLKTSLEKLDSVATPFVEQTEVDRNTIAALNKMGDVVLQLAGSDSAPGPDNASSPDEETKAGVRLARKFYARALELAQQIADADAADMDAQKTLMVCLHNNGLAAEQMTLTQESLGFYEQAVALGDRVGAEGSADAGLRQALINAVASVGDARFLMGEIREAFEAHGRALELAKAMLAEHPDSLRNKRLAAHSQERLGMLNFLVIEDYAKAIPHYENAVELREQIAASDPDNVGSGRSLGHAYVSLGNTLLKAKKTEQAKAFLGKALDLAKTLVDADPNNPEVNRDYAGRLRAVGKLREEFGEHEEAIKLYSQALEIDTKRATDDPDNNYAQSAVAQSENYIGNAYLKMKQPKEAIGHLKKAIARLKLLTTADATNAESRRDLNATYLALHKAEQGVQALTAFGDFDELMQQPPEKRSELLAMRGLAFAGVGRLEQAEQVGDALMIEEGGPKYAVLMDAACVYGACAEAISKAEKPTEAQKEEQARLLSKSIDAFRASMKAGWFEVELLPQLEGLSLTSRHPEYDAIVREMGEGKHHQLAFQAAVADMQVHLARLSADIEADPDNPSKYRERSSYYAMMRDWSSAVADLKQSALLEGRAVNRVTLLMQAIEHVIAGELDEHKKMGEKIAKVFEGSPIPPEAEIACKANLLLPGQVDPSTLPTKPVEDAVNQVIQEWFVSWGASTLALHAYRSGENEAAIEWTAKIDPMTWQQKPWAIGLVVRAMANHRLGNTEEAKNDLAAAAAIIPADLRALRKSETLGQLKRPVRSVQADWLYVEVLRREAQSLLKGETTEEYLNSWREANAEAN